MSRETLKLALEALQAVQPECDDFHHKKKEMHDWSETCKPLERYNQAIAAIKEALAQSEPSQEWMTEEEQTAYTFGWFKALEQRRTWVGLTDDEKFEVADCSDSFEDVVDAVESKLKEKNT